MPHLSVEMAKLFQGFPVESTGRAPRLVSLMTCPQNLGARPQFWVEMVTVAKTWVPAIPKPFSSTSHAEKDILGVLGGNLQEKIAEQIIEGVPAQPSSFCHV